MRTFVIKSNTAPSDAKEIDLYNLVSSGRIDAICRYISAALCLSNAIRRDTNIYICFNSGITCLFDGSKIIRFHSDEKRIAKMLKMIFNHVNKNGDILNHTKIFSGIYCLNKSFRELILDFKKQSKRVLCLHKEGKNIWTFKLIGNEVWVLGDQEGFGKDLDFIFSQADSLVSVSHYTLHGEHCISIIHNRIDNNEVVEEYGIINE